MDLIDLVLVPHPLKPGEVRTSLPGPMRLDALMEVSWPLGAPVTVWVDGAQAPAASWAGIEVAAGATVTLRPALAGDDTNPLRVVLQLALAVATAGLVGSAWFAGAGALARGLAVGGLALGGGLIVNAVAPPRAPELAGQRRAEPLYSLTGAANRARPYEPLMLVLGERKRVYPDLAAAEYTEFRGRQTNLLVDVTDYPDFSDFPTLPAVPSRTTDTVGGDQYLHGLYSFGVGDIEVTDLMLGDTPLADYEEVTTEILAPGEAPTIVHGNVDTTAGAELTDTTAVVRSSASNAERIAIDFVAQIVEIDDKGRFKGRTVQVRIDWTELVNGAPSSDRPQSRTVSLRGSGPDPIRRTVFLQLPGAGKQWQVAVRRLTAPSSSDRVTDAVAFTALRTYQQDTGDHYADTRLAVVIRATGQLHGRLDRLHATVRHRMPVWDATANSGAGAWTSESRATSSPAAISRQLARGVWHEYPGGARLMAGVGMAGARIDDAALGEWHEFCEREGLGCDYVVQRAQSRAQTLSTVMSCGRGDVSWASGKFGAVWEDAQDAEVGLITPDNVIAGTLGVDWTGAAQIAQEVVSRYDDADDDYRPGEARRLMTGVTQPTRTAEVTLHGVTSARQAARETNLMAAAQLYRRRAISWRMPLEGLAVGRAQPWWITHSLIDGGQTGRVAGGTAAAPVLDKAIDGEAVGDWLMFRLADGTLHTSRIAAVQDAATLAVSLATALPSAPGAGEAEANDILWRFYAAGSPPARVRITAIRPGSDGTIELVAVDDPPEYRAADTRDLTVTLAPRRRAAPAVVDAVITETITRLGLGYTITLTLALEVSGDWRGGSVLARVDDGPDRLVATIPPGETAASWAGPASGTVTVTVVPGSEAAPVGAAYTIAHIVRGLALGPPAPTGFAVANEELSRVYAWTPPAVEDLVGFRVRHAESGSDTAYADMDPLHEGLLTSSPWDAGVPAAGAWDFGIVAVDAGGRESVPAYARGVTLTAIEIEGGLKGADAVYFAQSVVEVPIRAVGPSITGAAEFAPNPAVADLFLVDGSERSSVRVTGDITGAGVEVTLSGADANDFEIVT